jgi:capsular exopolysaccharide synthesis family protein
MSRLYEALKGATRKRGDGNDQLWDALSLDGLETPSNASSATPPALPELEPAALRNISQALIDEQPNEADFGKEAKAGLDRNARLLPFAANATLADHYRRLRTKILQQREVKPFRSLVITSPSPQEGKTVTCTNLALSFSTLPNFKVLVIDGDLRRGTLGAWLGVSDDQLGLSDLFEGTAQLQDVVLKSDHLPMHFIVRGKSEVNDLHQSHFGDHFRRLSEMYDLVLVDSPPVNLLADAQILAANCDAVLLVARAFSTTRKSLEKAAQELAPFRIIGSVLNAGVTQRSSKYYGYY